MARHSRKRTRQHGNGELELMPMLNVFISIIPLLLLSAAFVPVSVIQTALPAGAAAPAPGDAATPVQLTIVIRHEAYVVAVDGRVERSIERSAGAAASRASLLEELRGLAQAHTGKREVEIVSEASTRYEDIIEVMDVARAAGLPEAALSGGLEGSL